MNLKEQIKSKVYTESVEVVKAVFGTEDLDDIFGSIIWGNLKNKEIVKIIPNSYLKNIYGSHSLATDSELDFSNIFYKPINEKVEDSLNFLLASDENYKHAYSYLIINVTQVNQDVKVEIDTRFVSLKKHPEYAQHKQLIRYITKTYENLYSRNKLSNCEYTFKISESLLNGENIPEDSSIIEEALHKLGFTEISEVYIEDLSSIKIQYTINLD